MKNEVKLSKRSVAVKFGLIGGIVAVIYFMIQDFTGIAGDVTYDYFNFAISLLIVITTITISHSYYKRNADGFLNYSEGVEIGALLSVIASFIHSSFTYIYVILINTNYVENLREKQTLSMQEKGYSNLQIERAMEITEPMTSPLGLLIVGILWGSLFGLILSLVISFFTKKSRNVAYLEM